MLTSLRRLLIPLAIVGSTAGAQSDSSIAHAAAPSACVAAIPATALRPVAVYLTATVDDSLHPGVKPAVDNMLQPLADHFDAMLGAGRDTIPRGEPRINWIDVDRANGVRIVWRLDGTAGWSLRRDSTAADTNTGPASALLLRAVEAAQKAGELTMLWPSAPGIDSIGAVVQFYRTRPDSAGHVEPTKHDPLVPVLTVRAPWEQPVRVRRMRAPPYPSGAEHRGARGTVMMEFVVDSTGRADTTTVHDIWPANRPRLTGELAAYYLDFINAARGSIAAGTFDPASIGGCPVRQRVQQPFSFTLR